MSQSAEDLLNRLAVVDSRPHDREAASIESRLAAVLVRVDDLDDSVTRLSRDFYEAARDPLSQAIPAIVQLGEIIVLIPKTIGVKQRILISKSKVAAAAITTTCRTLILCGGSAIRSAETVRVKKEELDDRVAESLARITELIQITDGWVNCALELEVITQDAAKKHPGDVKEAHEQLVHHNDTSDSASTGSEGLESSRESKWRALSAIQNAQRKVNTSKGQFKRVSRLRTCYADVSKSLQTLESRLEGELACIRNTIKDAAEVSGFMAKLAADAHRVDSANVVVDLVGQIRRLQREIDPRSVLEGPFFDDPCPLMEGLMAISDAGGCEHRDFEPHFVAGSEA